MSSAVPVAEFFDRLSPRYRKHFELARTGASYNFRRRLELACEMTSSLSGRLLDCGCGTGEITTAILRSGRFPAATVIDISQKMLNSAKELVVSECPACDLSFLQTDLFALNPVPLGRFDIIVCLGVLSHVGRIGDLLAKLRSLLQPQGAILFQATRAEHIGTWLFDRLAGPTYAARHGYRMVRYTTRQMGNAFRAAGLAITQSRRHSLYIPFADQVFPSANHYLERMFSGWSSRHGADAIFLLSLGQSHDT